MDDPSQLTNGRVVKSWVQSADPGEDASVDAEDDSPAAPPPAPGATPPRDAAAATTALERARLWIDVAMPYCGGPNGGADVICGGTCVRTGRSKAPAWDAYRSDCSGFVSWSWGLAAPGASTASLAPFDTRVSEVITVDDLAPGDALNTSGHVMLFGGWVDRAANQATILQESRCGQVAEEKVITLTPLGPTSLARSDGRRFTPIRKKAR